MKHKNNTYANTKEVEMDAATYKRIQEEIAFHYAELKDAKRLKGIDDDIRNKTRLSDVGNSSIVIENLIKVKEYLLENAKIVNSSSVANMVGLGDIVRLNMIYAIDDQEEVIVKLVGSAKCIPEVDYEETSITSPLGSVINNQTIGSLVAYKVHGKTIQVEILEKLNNIHEEDNDITKPKIKQRIPKNEL